MKQIIKTTREDFNSCSCGPGIIFTISTRLGTLLVTHNHYSISNTTSSCHISVIITDNTQRHERRRIEYFRTTE